jgi:hypothetical protein
MCLHTRRDTLVGMRNLFEVIRMELRVKPPPLLNLRSKVCSTVQLHVFVFVSLFNKKINKKYLTFFFRLKYYFRP